MSDKKTIYAKLLEVKELVPKIKRNGEGYGYEYVTPEKILGTLNPLLNERGLFLKTEVTDSSAKRIQVPTKNGPKEETLVWIKMRFTWIDAESGDTDVSEFVSYGCNGEEQGFGSALTYGERYFLLKTFNIPQGKDDPDHVKSKRAADERAPDAPNPTDKPPF